MSYELIALTMFGGMLLLMLTGQRVFAAIGFVSAAAAMLLYGNGAVEMPFNAAFKLFNWYPMLTLPLFVYMGYVLSESGIADDLYTMFHVWFGGIHGGLAVGTIGLMVVISAMNGLSVAGMAIGATIALPEMLRGCPGREFVGDIGTTQCRSGSLWHDCPSACRQTLAGWRLSWTDDGGIFCHIYCYQM